MNDKIKCMLTVVVVLVLVGGIMMGQQFKMIELNVSLPKALLEGTPKDIKNTNLDPVNKGKKRSPFFVPEDTILLSVKKTVTSSDSFPVNGSLDLVADGDKESVEGSYVELGPGKQWIQMDLGVTCNIHAMLVWHFHSMAQVYRDVVVQVADDADFITNVRTVFNNDNDNSSGLGGGKDYEYIETNEGKLVAVRGEKARFVRFYSNGSTAGEMNRYIEVEVYGSAAR